MLDREGAVQQAEEADRGAFQESASFYGIPIAVGDFVELKGCSSGYVSSLLKDEISISDSNDILRLRNESTLFLGKTSVSKFGFGACTQVNNHPCRNPWNLDYGSAGESGGAAAVAAGLTPCVIDIERSGGSRLPASFCGVLALKTSRGTITNTKQLPTPPSIKVCSASTICARYPKDIAQVLALLEGNAADQSQENEQERYTIAWSPDLGFLPPSPRCSKWCRIH